MNLRKGWRNILLQKCYRIYLRKSQPQRRGPGISDDSVCDNSIARSADPVYKLICLRDFRIAPCAISRGTYLCPDLLGRSGVLDIARSNRVESQASNRLGRGPGQGISQSHRSPLVDRNSVGFFTFVSAAASRHTVETGFGVPCWYRPHAARGCTSLVLGRDSGKIFYFRHCDTRWSGLD